MCLHCQKYCPIVELLSLRPVERPIRVGWLCRRTDFHETTKFCCHTNDGPRDRAATLVHVTNSIL